ncbi:hypothetical protein [Lacticaseibacillus paracasei]|uniref:hypothetical protein n=1 Tax=Lacticaseibacillus paracasei TaxID=1597 RepID=UPI001896DD11|nr:hypothetical protein [Lacticaseibacillus paracasei]
MTQVTVRLYKKGEKVWRDFKAELLKRYEKAVMLDISESEAFSKIEKQEFKEWCNSVWYAFREERVALYLIYGNRDEKPAKS